MQDQRSLLHALHVLGSIRKDDKIGIGDSLYIEPGGSVWTSMSRWYYGQSRTGNFQDIDKIFRDALQQCDKLLERREYLLKNAENRLELMENCQLLNEFRSEIQAALIGTANLAQTYQGDATAVACIYTINQFVNNALERIKSRYTSLDLFSQTKQPEDEADESEYEEEDNEA